MADERPPWEAIDAGSVPAAESAATAGHTPSPTPSPAAADDESWMLGSGFDTDMEGDVNPNQGNNLRLWIPKGAEKIVIFATDGHEAPVLWEHSGQIGGSWRNWCTCLEPLGVECPGCKFSNIHKGKFRRYKARYFTVIDLSEFTDSKGAVRKNERRLLVAKKDTSEIIKRKYLSRKDAGETLSGAMFKIFRPPTDKSASVGEDYEFIKMVNLSDYGFANDPNKEFIKPNGQLDLGKLVKPDPAKMKIMYDRLMAESGGDVAAGRPEGTGSKISY